MATYTTSPHSPTIRAPPPSKENGKPSSFVLKLNTMVHGAPDDIVSVSNVTHNCSSVVGREKEMQC